MLKIVIHTAFAIIISSYLIWSNVNAEETLSVTQSPETVEEAPPQSFLSSASDSHFEKDFSASVGVKMWMNQWNLPDAIIGDNHQKFIMSYTSGTETTLIPVLSVRTKNWLVSGSYFTKTEYGFEKQSIGLATSSGNTVLGIMLKEKRTEWDINIGYYLHKYLLVTAGHKGIERIVDVTGELSGRTGTAPSITLKSSGPTLGIAGAVPLQGRFGLYGNFAYGRLGNDDRDPADYYLGDMGIFYSFKFTKVVDAAMVSLGYRFQSLYYKGVNELEMRDGTEGFALSLNVTF